MKYRYEARNEGEIVMSALVSGNNPNQILNFIARRLNFYSLDVHILNEDSKYWNYILQKTNGKYRVIPVERRDVFISRAMLLKVLYGNKKITEVV